ncbi:MAG: 50S ribosomal protein L4 [Nitrospiria bacterium]
MFEVDVVNQHNEKSGSVTLDDRIFGATVSFSLLHEVVKMQLASRRQGTASTKSKGFVRGGGKKPWRQKGTGRARAGSNRSPLWKGGGTVFGPTPRSYAYSMPKKKSRKALYAALSATVQEGRLVVLEEWRFSDVKTRSIVHLLDRLHLGGIVLIAVSQLEEDFERMTRNIRNVKVVEIRNLNVYDLVRSDTLLISERDIARLCEVWGGIRESA